MSLRAPLVSDAFRLVSGRTVAGVGSNMVVIGASENPVVTVSSLVRTIGRKGIGSTTLSIMRKRPVAMTGRPLFRAKEVVYSPRTTCGSIRTRRRVVRILTRATASILGKGGPTGVMGGERLKLMWMVNRFRFS